MPASRPGFRLEILEERHAADANCLFNQVFSQQRSLDHYLWKFWKNPAGPPVGMVAIEEDSDRLVAMNTGVVRRFWVNGAEARAMYAVENAVLPEVRGGGFLFRAVTAGMVCSAHQQDVMFAYGGQSTEEAIRIGRRLFNYQDLFLLRSWSRRLSFVPAVESRFSGKVGSGVSKLVGKVADKAKEMASVFAANPSADVNSDIDVVSKSECDQEFDALWEAKKCQYQVVAVRDTPTLRWRWMECPVGPNHFLFARQRGAPAGYLVWRVCEEEGLRVARVLDLFDGLDSSVASALLSVASDSASEADCSFITCAAEDNSPAAKAMRQLPGFKLNPREPDDRIIGTVMSYPDRSPEDYDQQRSLLIGSGWYYTQGDIDFRD